MSSPNDRDGLTRRPATESDRALLYRLYATTREAELSQLSWTEEQKELFVRQQFHAQDTYYHQQCPHAAYDVIEFHGEPVGRLYVDVRPEGVQLMEITLLPEFRGRGLGTALIHEVIAQADSLALPVRLFVESWNPAQRLYARLGFVFVEDNGPYQLLARPFTP